MVPVLMQAPPDDLALFCDRHAFSGFGGLNRGALAGRSGADHDHVESLHACVESV
jgi:hypothetical protein